LAERGIPISEASLRQAIARDDPQAVRILLLAGPGMQPRALRGILNTSLEHNRLRIAGAFVEAGIRPPEGALADAAADGNLELVRFLVEQGVGDRGDALEEAVEEHHWRVVRYLVDEAGASLAPFEDEAEDLLVEMAERGNLEAVTWLLRAGVNARGDAGEDALEEAESNGHSDVVVLLRRARGGSG
jgi:ankyrin repeat protein